MQTYENFGRALRVTRTARGLRQADIAVLAGLGRERISRLESGLKANPRDVVAVTRALNTTLERMLANLELTAQ